MSFLSHSRRPTGRIFLIACVFVAIGAAFVVATNRAGAASIIAAVANSITCSSTGTSACFNATNSSSGVAVYGTSKSGTGLRGASTSNYGLKATSTSGEGVFGQSTSGTAAVAGTMTSGVGVYGYTTGDSGGTGVFGSSYGGTGVFAVSEKGYALTAYSNGDPAGYFSNANGNGVDTNGTYIGIVARAPAGSSTYPIVATDSQGNDLFYIDGNGDVEYHGSLGTFARTQGGSSATAFTTKTTAPTLEDTGTAQLSSGASIVRLDPTFAATIDRSTPYRVFVTPHGDSRGLYVASESTGEFTVRESQGGRSTMTFDYRIVAAPLGHTRERMTMVGRDPAAPFPRAELGKLPPKMPEGRVLPKLP